MSADEHPDRYPRPNREPLPFEDLENHRYLHDRDGLLAVEHFGEDQRFYLPVERFMDVQHDRDEHKRAVAIINAALTEYPQRRAEEVLRSIEAIVRSTGLTDADGQAMQSIIRSVRES